MASDALHEYTGRLDERCNSISQKDRLHARIGNLRLILFVCAAIIAWFALRKGALSIWWLLPVLCGFGALVIWHESVLQARRRFERAAAFYERGLARLQDRWTGRGTQGLRYAAPGHPYAEDLDLFGRGSLFELLCTARTRAGEDELASWLLSPAAPRLVCSRQAAVEELRSKLDLREGLAVAGAQAAYEVDPASLSAWAGAPPVLLSAALRVSAAALGLAALSGLVGWALSGQSLWFAIPAAIEGIFALRLRRRVRRVIEAVDRPARDLDLLAALLHILESEKFHSARLVEVQRELESSGHPPSVQIRRLRRLIVLLDSRRNQLFAVIAGPLLWGTQMAFAIEAWRHRSGSAVGRWLAAVGEMEALCSLAGYAYEHPRDPFPGVDENGPRFEATGLTHPLLPENRSVRNDVRLGPDLRVLVVSGSNMSGKSTLLRSVGANAVLAFAGGPVRAHALTLSPLAIGASIRITDSLQAGSSRFYTEITRLRQLVDMTRGPAPLLFLLDELLQGTNSHDRRIGAEAVVRGLTERGAIGLLTTHDLALAHIAELLAPKAANVHFEDHIENGRMAFDFMLRPGVVQRSNALELMRSVGLDV